MQSEININNCIFNIEFTFKYNGECDFSKDVQCTEGKVKASKVSREVCDKACTKIYDPVCGFNGKCYKTFSSDCFLGSQNCENRQNNEMGKSNLKNSIYFVNYMLFCRIYLNL